MTHGGEFDEYAEGYDAALQEGISATGEDKEYFARGRIEWLRTRLETLNLTPSATLDFGCGTGSATPHLLRVLGARSVVGVDVSPRSLDEARKTWGADNARFLRPDDYNPDGAIDLVFCNGVFHHIPPADRVQPVRFIHRALRSGGIFAFWENNPWNPGTRYIMSRCPFDRDALMLFPSQARRLLRSGGFEILSTTYAFIFPRPLRALRAMEPWLARWPVGGQYQILCRKR